MYCVFLRGGRWLGQTRSSHLHAFAQIRRNMSSTKIKLPNSVEYEQPLGLFIANEFIAGNGQEFEVIDPS